MINPYMMTQGGRRFHFLDPDPACIDFGDIAYALHHINRYTGHAGPYSVAQHSVRVMRRARELGADKATVKHALMHDAHEAYIGDVSSPLKIAIGFEWTKIEAKAMAVVAEVFDLRGDMSIIHLADRQVTHAEARHFLGTPSHGWATDPCAVDWSASIEFESACDILGIR